MRKTLNQTPPAARARRPPRTGLKFHRILVPLDFSGFARQALACAVPLARKHQAKISLVHVVQPPVVLDALPDGVSHLPVNTDINTGNLVNMAKARLAALATQLLPGDLLDRTVVREGNPAYEVTAAAKALKADLIVLSTHGRSGLPRLLLGSTAERIVRHAPCSVLTVRRQPGGPALRRWSQEKPVYPERLPWRRMLVPLDFSLTSLRALHVAVPLARQSDAQLFLLHVVEPDPYPAGLEGEVLVMPDSALPRNAQTLLPRVARRFVPPSVPVTSLIDHGRAADVIVATAEEKGVDLIVLSTHGHTGLERMLMGSTAEQVVRHAKCPVFVVRQARG